MKIEKIELNGESIYLKKDFLGWRTVDPIMNEEGNPISSMKDLPTAKIDKDNVIRLIFGSKRNLLILIILLAIAGISIYFHYKDLNTLRESCLVFKDTFNVGFNNVGLNLAK